MIFRKCRILYNHKLDVLIKKRMDFKYFAIIQNKSEKKKFESQSKFPRKHFVCYIF